MKDVMFSSKSGEWETPQWLYDKLDDEFHFTLDPCAADENHKCDKYYTKKENGLAQDWKDDIVFMNPPYGRKIGQWVEKAYYDFLRGATVVCLLPSRTDTKWWHDYCMKGKIRFIKGRLRFVGAKYGAPFPSAIVIFQLRDYPNFFGETSTAFLRMKPITICETYERNSTY
jgi:phage N-6-adenine-methyltransferase